MNDEKRMFFGVEIAAAWPSPLPSGRMVPEESRHITLAFLGNHSISHLTNLLPQIPKPDFRIGIVGICDDFIFLPKRHPRVIAGHVKWLEEENALQTFQKKLADWLRTENYQIDTRDFLAHISIAREPFSDDDWKNAFSEFPVFIKAIHLYESVGSLTYVPLWSHLLFLPFEDLEHTADIAYVIRGENLEQLYLHAQMALAFECPALTAYLSNTTPNSLDDIVFGLNEIVAQADQEVGAPFKAVSFHGNIVKQNNQLLEWEMIVDV